MGKIQILLIHTVCKTILAVYCSEEVHFFLLAELYIGLWTSHPENIAIIFVQLEIARKHPLYTTLIKNREIQRNTLFKSKKMIKKRKVTILISFLLTWWKDRKQRNWDSAEKKRHLVWPSNSVSYYRVLNIHILS